LIFLGTAGTSQNSARFLQVINSKLEIQEVLHLLRTETFTISLIK
jgi:hypothetical protein